MNQTQHSYQLVTAQDGIVWLSLQPCIEDLKERFDKTQEPHIREAIYAARTLLEAFVLEAKQVPALLKKQDENPN